MLSTDSASQTVISLFKTQNPDFGGNRVVTCLIKENKFTIQNLIFFQDVTNGTLDQDQTHNKCHSQLLTRASCPFFQHQHCPILSSTSTAPQFSTKPHTFYTWLSTTLPRVSIAQVSVSDPDLGTKGHVSYSFLANDPEPRALSAYVVICERTEPGGGSAVSL